MTFESEKKIDFSGEEPLLNQIKSILPLIEQVAEASEQAGQLDQSVLNAIYEHQLFRLFIPKQYNGSATDLVTALKVFELIATADGATGWLVMIGAGGGLFSGFLENQAAETIFAPEQTVIAGSGMPSGVAKPMKDGYEVSGHWKYASGSDYANWFTANCLVEGTDNDIISIAVPADQVVRHSTWKVFGMKATGSHDFSVESVWVPNAHTFSLAKPPVLDDAIFFCPLDILASLTFTSVAIGIAQHALAEFINFAKHKTVLGSKNALIEMASVQQYCTESEQLLQQSRKQLHQYAEDVWQAAQHQQTPSEVCHKSITKESIEMVQDCVQMVDGLKRRSGMLAVFESTPFSRAWRDLHTLSQHIIVSYPL